MAILTKLSSSTSLLILLTSCYSSSITATNLQRQIQSTETAATGVDLGGGVVTRTDVEVYADLALDLRDMRTYETSDAILRIYEEGRNAEFHQGYKLRLKDLNDLLSDDASSSTLTPNYLYQLYGLSELNPLTYKTYEHYADNFIRSTIMSKQELASETIVALSMWMYATHLLLWSVDMCAKQSVADNPDTLQTLDGGGFDEFIALWIGMDQQAGSDDGHGLYAWAQRAYDATRTANPGDDYNDGSPEALVNTKLKLLYQEGAGILSFNQACSKQNPDSAQQLWVIAQQIISYMYVPQFQNLINAITDQDNDLTALYATALIPQLSQCRPSTFKHLRDSLLNGNVNFGKSTEILALLSETYSCFGLSCEDIGTCNSDFDSSSTALYPALAGYPPTTDVEMLSKIDLDILQLRILTSLDSFSFAKYLYLYGKNSMKYRDSENDPIEFYSLHFYGTSSKRHLADPTFSQFEEYFNEENYAHTAIMKTFDGSSKWKSNAQRSEVIVGTSAYSIMFIHFVVELNEALDQCRNPDPDWIDGNTHPWDEVAAILIGSLEGTKSGGSADLDDGQLLWNLGNSRAFQFQSMNSQNYAEVNSDIIDLLFAGKGELDALDCTSLEYTVHRIQKIALIGLVQSVMRYAILSDNLFAESTNVDLALGETYALAILPILSSIDKLAAEVIKENMIHKDDVKPVRDGPQVVAEALGESMAKYGINCHDLGSTSQADPCKTDPKTIFTMVKPSSSAAGGTTTLSLTAMVNTVGVIIFVFCAILL